MIISKTPFLLSFAGNPMRYRLTNNSGGDSMGVLSVVRFSFSDVDKTVDHAVTISKNGIERTLTLKNNPTLQEHLPVAEDGYSPTDWCQACYDYLTLDVEFSTDYSIELSGTDIIFTAKNAGTAYDITQGSSTITGLLVSTQTAGDAPGSGVVDGVLMRIYKNDNSGLLLGEEYKPLDSSGIVQFDVQDYLYADLLMAPAPRFHDSIAGGCGVYTDYIFKYKVYFIDRVDGVLQGRAYNDTQRYAIAGGLNREDLVANNLSQVDFFGLTDTKSSFLTWQTNLKTTDKIAKESLFFAFQQPVGYSQYQLKITYWDSAGANETTVTLTSPSTITPFTVLEISVGYTELGLSSYLFGEVAKWKVFLVNELGSIISDEFTFELDQFYHENIRYFRFRNSWGVYDSLRCTGNFELNLEHERESATYISEDEETSYNSPVKTIYVRQSQLFKANTGFVTRNAREYLRDFERSFDIYEYDQGRLYPVNITSKKSNLAKDGEYNYFLSFEYERAYSDFFFSRMLRAIVKKIFSAEFSAEFS